MYTAIAIVVCVVRSKFCVKKIIESNKLIIQNNLEIFFLQHIVATQ